MTFSRNPAHIIWPIKYPVVTMPISLVANCSEDKRSATSVKHSPLAVQINVTPIKIMNIESCHCDIILLEKAMW